MKGSKNRMKWLTKETQRKIVWRDGDIVISVPGKSGTTWTMNIVHQIREGGTADFEDIYVEVPWLEHIDRPGRTLEEIVDKFNAMPTSRRRAFKTHSFPPNNIPYFDPEESQRGDEIVRDVKYVVVVRNPDDAMASLYPFMMRHNTEHYDLWGLPRDSNMYPDFESFHREFIINGGFDKDLFEFMKAWWSLRNKPNVLLLHYNDMKKDRKTSIKKISDFLGYDPSPESWDRILEYTSFPWMKENEEKFEARTIAPVPVMQRGAMLRRGESGLADQDGVTKEISKITADRGREILEDEEAFWFLYNGMAPRT